MHRLLFLLALTACPATDEEDSANDSVEDSSSDSDSSEGFDAYTHGSSTTTVRTDDLEAEHRTYELSSNHTLRDDLPPGGALTVVELPGQMRLRSGRLLVDALFALAIQEVRDNSVEEISDGAFDRPVACSCFETGEKWTWVWTRDTGYAVEHALAMVDPVRSRNSLQFKISDRKASVGGGEPSIVQDTGSGGSWPVSTDRAVWALGAWETLKFLDGAERTAFRDQAYTAMVNTLEQDRVYVYDPDDGLYRGEQSFLDWREQSYPSWTATDTAHLGMSKSLSTNLAHFRMMQVAADLADEKGETAARERYRAWQTELGSAIDRELWLEADRQYSAMKTTTLDPAPLRKLDLLGESMAALWLADASRAERMVEAYPHAPGGPPVLWPQQPLIPIYHNRGVWPFVTAYDLRAAKRAGNSAVFMHDFESLVRGSALNLSNMENFEFLSQGNWVDDGPYSGPVVNSRRQLWSVAGFIAAVTRGLFGVEASQTGLVVDPFVPEELVAGLLAGSERLSLLDMPYRGALVDLHVTLPPSTSGDGAYAVRSVSNDGVDVAGLEFTVVDGAQIEIALGSPVASTGEIREVFDGDFTQLWAPQEPSITSLTLNAGSPEVSFDASGESGVTASIFRDGLRVATGLAGTSYVDTAVDGDTSHCYAVETEFASGNVSHHSPASCWWGSSSERVHSLPASGFRAVGGTLVTNWGREHYEGWGAPSHTIEADFTAPSTARYLVQATYGNGSGPVNTGVTAGHKRLEVWQSTTLVAEGSLLMPHLGTWDAWEDSSFAAVDLVGGQTYTVRLSDAPNMSWLEHHRPYRHAGGGADPVNAVNIAELKLLQMSR